MCKALHTEWQGSEQPGHRAQSSDSYSGGQRQLETVPTSEDVNRRVNVWFLQDTLILPKYVYTFFKSQMTDINSETIKYIKPGVSIHFL